MNVDEFTREASQKHHGRYFYVDVVSIPSTAVVDVTCQLHGNFKVLPGDHLNGTGCPECGKLGGDYFRFVELVFRVASRLHKDLAVTLSKYGKTGLSQLVYDMEQLEGEVLGNDLKSAIGNDTLVFVEEGNFTLPVKHVKVIRKVDGYDYGKDMPVYNLVINPGAEDSYLNNTEMVFYTPEARETAYKKLKNKLQNFDVVFI